MQRKAPGGAVLPPETIAGETIAFNRFVKKDGSTGKFLACDAGEYALGIVENDIVGRNLDDTNRTSFLEGDEMAVKYSGPAYIEAGENLAVNDLVKPGSNGVAMKYTPTAGNATFLQAEMVEALAQYKTLRAVVIEAADTGELAKVILLGMG